MSQTALQVENISKLYRLGQVGTGTISHDLNRWWHRIRGKDDPYEKIGEVNDRTRTGSSPYVWALREVNFEVEQGDIIGVIGRNGTGKSTLLKILSKVTSPTSGTVKARGRIAALLEVGTGFHPELTGRENIYLNGTILGMSKREVAAKLDEIVDFAGVERYLDTPVKRFSSGMMVRLGFAVAAHLEPEILLVDEVLAVGDEEFQQKAVGKLSAVSKNEGRTVLFVSHNLGAVRKLCNRGMLLENGGIAYQGDVENTIKTYLGSGLIDPDGNGSVFENNLLRVTTMQTWQGGEPRTMLLSDQPSQLRIGVVFHAAIKDCKFYIRVADANGYVLFCSLMNESAAGDSFDAGSYRFEVEIPANTFICGTYSIMLQAHINRQGNIIPIEGLHHRFRVEETGIYKRKMFLTSVGQDYAGSLVLENIRWQCIRQEVQ